MAQIRILSTNYLGNSSSILLLTENQRILFDSGEGIQRLCVENKAKLSKLESIFISYISQETLAGLPGLYLTSADSGRTQLDLIGPEGLKSFWISTNHFTYRLNFNLKLIEIKNEIKVIEYEKVFIYCLPIGLLQSHICYIIETKVLPGKFDINKAKQLGVPIGPLCKQLQSGNSITLQDGRIITPDLVLAPSEKSRFAAIICNCLNSQNISSDTLVNEIISHPFWTRFESNNVNCGQLDCIIHLNPSIITSSNIYSTWMKRLSEMNNTTNIMLGTNDCIPLTAFMASTTYTSKLHKLFPDNFAPLTMVLSSSINGIEENNLIIRGYPGLSYNLLPSRLRGIESIPFDKNIFSDISSYLQSKLQEDLNTFWLELDGDNPESNLVKLLSNSKHNKEHILLTQTFQDQIFNENESITFLGTGCAQPSKYRNVSGIFVQLEGGSLLLDCGEGSWQQLIRMVSYTPRMMFLNYNNDNNNMEINPCLNDIQLWIANQLKVVWISHPHADHHLGLIRVISERKRLLFESNQFFEPLLVIAPESVLTFVKNFEEFDPLLANSYLPVNNRCFDLYEMNLRCTPCGEDTLNNSNSFRKKFDDTESLAISLQHLELSRPILNSLGIDIFENIRVIHCSQSYAVSIVSKKGWKLVYSGDTRPSNRLIEMGKNASILIHEATFSDCKADEALKKKHSTISEAINVAKEMKAQSIILTHFSQRYPSTPPLPSDCLETEKNPTTYINDSNFPRVILAYDFMRLTFRDCLWANNMNSVLTLAFPPEKESDNINDNDNDNDNEEEDDDEVENGIKKQQSKQQQQQQQLKHQSKTGKSKRDYNNDTTPELKEKDRNSKKLKKVSTKKSEEVVLSEENEKDEIKCDEVLEEDIITNIISS